MKTFLILFSLALVLAACTQAPPPEDKTLGPAHSANWQKLLNESDVEGLVDLYTEDARILPPNAVMKSGTAAVQEEFGGMVEAGLKMELESMDSSVSGDIGYNVGTYALRAGGSVVDTGKFVETWRRGSDGVWRISNDIWNSDNPPAAKAKTPMTHRVFMHEVGDPAVWLAAWRRDPGRKGDFAAHGAPHVHVMQSPDNPKLTGLVVGFDDPQAFDAWLQSDAGVAAATEDTVDLDSVTVLMEVE